ncbi:unnamed protein product [Merluccius merluccius]
MRKPFSAGALPRVTRRPQRHAENMREQIMLPVHFEIYTSKVVGNGLNAQRHNPEVKVRSPDPYLEEVKKRLEQFNQETHESFPETDQNTSLNELGSGEVEEGSTTDCDDEDGCQASGDGKDKTGQDRVEKQECRTGIRGDLGLAWEIVWLQVECGGSNRSPRHPSDPFRIASYD